MSPSRLAVCAAALVALAGPGCTQLDYAGLEGQAAGGVVVSSYPAEIRGGLSDLVKVAIPDGTDSFLVEVQGAEGMYSLAKLVDPGGADLVESAAFQTRYAREVEGLVDWLFPNRPDLRTTPGEYQLVVRSETSAGGRGPDESVRVRVYTKPRMRDQACGIRLDFLVDADAIAVADFDVAIERVVGRVNELFQQIGISVIDYAVYPVELGSASYRLQELSATVDTVDAVLTDVRRRGGVREGSVRILVLRSLGDRGTAGYSMGLPGPFEGSRPTSAVLVSTEAYADGQGYLDVPGFATTVAHEVGHYLGLYHTSERSGEFHDPIPDTPECELSDCTGDFSRNLMTQSGGSRRDLLSTGQGVVMRRHPLCMPLDQMSGGGGGGGSADTAPPVARCDLTCEAPYTCAVNGGLEQCLEACDPQGTACFYGECVADDRGTYVCVY